MEQRERELRNLGVRTGGLETETLATGISLIGDQIQREGTEGPWVGGDLATTIGA